MRLIHFSDLNLLVPKSVQQVEASMKPQGLWVSDESEDPSWSSWCTENEFGLGEHPFQVTLDPDADVLFLTTAAELKTFADQYRQRQPLHDFIDWTKVAHRWQGIVITPYQWMHRLDEFWYYGWDCASGCIWDAAAIAAVAPAEQLA